jgi:flagellar secretion chaperone FliS
MSGGPDNHLNSARTHDDTTKDRNPMNSALRNRYFTDGAGSLSQERLLLALYDRLLADLDQATLAIDERDPSLAHEKLIHGQQIVEELHLALDPNTWPGARQLGAVYLYAHDLLVRANLTKDAAVVREARSVIEPLADAWRAAYAELAPRAVGVTPGMATATGSFSWGA